MTKQAKLALMAICVLMLAAVMTGVAVAQEETPPELPPCVLDNGLPASCMLFKLPAETMVGEVWFNDIPFIGDLPKYSAFIDIEFVAGLTGKFEFRNIEDSGDPNFNLLYVYKDARQTFVTPPLGEWRIYELTPTKKYIRQAVELTCAIKNWVDEAVACGVVIDGVPQPDLIAPGMADSYALDPGAHIITLGLVSTLPPAGDPTQPTDPAQPVATDQTVLWSPASVTKTVYAYATSYVSKQTFTFSKAGHLMAAMDQPTALADWYLDGVLVGEQAATLDVWVNPFKGHKVEIKNITDEVVDNASPPSLFHWKDATQYPFVGTGQSKTVTFKLLKEGDWAQPFEYVVPTGSLAEGAHTYFMSVQCLEDQPQPPSSSTPVTFSVDPAAEVVYPHLYLRLAGVLATKDRRGEFFTAVNPQQPLRARITWINRDRAELENLAARCTQTLNLDGVEYPMPAGLIYRIIP